MSSPFIPIITADLDWRDDLPFSVVYDDIYFSAVSGIKQSRYVFVDGNNLIHRWQNLESDESVHFNIGETGFGTGLNFLMTWYLWKQYAPQSAHLHFISCEKHPLKLNDLIKCLSYWPELAEQANLLIEKYPVLTPGYHQISFDGGRISLTLMLGDAFEVFEQLLICGEPVLEAELRSTFIDAWYLDGFAPQKNQSMWSEALLKVIAMLSKKGTTLATYTAASSVKMKLTEVGFILDKKKGFGPKRHMLTGLFNKNSVDKFKHRHTPWHVSKRIIQQNKSAIVVGAGLAGSFTAYSLANRGWQVTIVDELNSPGMGGSANQQAVLFPKLSAYKSPLTQFMLKSFLFANQVYKFLLQKLAFGDLKGSLLLAYNTREKKTQHSLEDWLSYYPELGELVDVNRASELAGISLDHSGLFIPLSGWINSPALCHHLLKNDKITFVPGQKIDSLNYDSNQWQINSFHAPVLILANGPKVNSFNETQHLPVKTIRGQMTAIQSTKKSQQLLMPVCGEGHVLPELNGLHYLGATYDLEVSTPLIIADDDVKNLDKLNQLADESTWSRRIIDHWAGIRASAPDYLPLVGQAPKDEEFFSIFAGLESNSKRWIPKAGPYFPGLYMCAGFGSRGLTTIPLSAEWLASLINNEMSCLPRSLEQAISPARFLRRTITRGF